MARSSSTAPDVDDKALREVEREEAYDYLLTWLGPNSRDGGIGLCWPEMVRCAKAEGIREAPLHRARLLMVAAGQIEKVYNPMFLGEQLVGAYWRLVEEEEMTGVNDPLTDEERGFALDLASLSCPACGALPLTWWREGKPPSTRTATLDDLLIRRDHRPGCPVDDEGATP